MIWEYKDFIGGVTFSGGDPMVQWEAVNNIARWCKEQGLQTTMYTGFTMEYIIKRCPDVLDYMDYIVDGRFEKELQSRDCPFRGSLNQRLWHKLNNRWETEM